MMFKNISRYSWFSFIPFIILGIVTITLFINSVIPLWYLWFTFLGWVCIAGLGVAVGFHRIFSHNTHPNLPKWTKIQSVTLEVNQKYQSFAKELADSKGISRSTLDDIFWAS